MLGVQIRLRGHHTRRLPDRFFPLLPSIAALPLFLGTRPPSQQAISNPRYPPLADTFLGQLAASSSQRLVLYYRITGVLPCTTAVPQLLAYFLFGSVFSLLSATERKQKQADNTTEQSTNHGFRLCLSVIPDLCLS